MAFQSQQPVICSFSWEGQSLLISNYIWCINHSHKSSMHLLKWVAGDLRHCRSSPLICQFASVFINYAYLLWVVGAILVNNINVFVFSQQVEDMQCLLLLVCLLWIVYAILVNHINVVFPSKLNMIHVRHCNG